MTPRILASSLWLTTLLVMLNGHAMTAKGIIYEDKNGDGERQANEPGIPNIRVSDGVSIANSNDAGAWSLEIEDEAVIFVSKPTGYRLPVNDMQLPQFYYIHQPQGSPKNLRYLGIQPTGELPASIDFGLTKQIEPADFSAVLFADPQPQTEVELDYIRDGVVSDLIGTDAKFGMTMGDIMFDDLSLFNRLNRIIGQIGIPWYNVPGNHELNLLAENDKYSLETFKRHYGPPYYSFAYGGAHFFVLDNIEYQGNGQSDPADVRGSGGYIAKFGKRQLAWLKRELAYIPNDALVFLAMHSPLETYVGEAPGITTADRKGLFKLLGGRPNLYSVAGHTHTTEHLYFDQDDGFRGPGEFHHHVLSAVSGSWWSGPFDEEGIPTSWQRDGSPNGYHLLDIKAGTDVGVRFQAAGKPSDYQMRIMFDAHHHGLRKDGQRDFRPRELLDSRIGVARVPSTTVLVNLFDGGPKSKVSMRIDAGAALPMQRVDRKDPLIVEMFDRHADSKKSWVNAMPSSHLFAADLPDDLGVGVYTLSVQAVDEFGENHHAHAVLEIVGD